jgi:hypothetical protein
MFESLSSPTLSCPHLGQWGPFQLASGPFHKSQCQAEATPLLSGEAQSSVPADLPCLSINQPFPKDCPSSGEGARSTILAQSIFSLDHSTLHTPNVC